MNGILKIPQNLFLWIHYMDAHGPYYGKARNLPLAKLFYEVRWQKAIRSKPLMRLTHNLLADYVHELKYLDRCFKDLIEFFKSKDILAAGEFRKGRGRSMINPQGLKRQGPSLCSRHSVPPLKDAEGRRQGAAVLFQLAHKMRFSPCGRR